MSVRGAPATAGKRRGRSHWAVWHSVRVRAVFYQVLVVALVVGTAAWMIGNALDALTARGIASGFGYLSVEAGFGIGESVIPFQPADTYLRAFFVGLLNTLKVSVASIVAATLIGTLLGIMRLSRNLGVSRLAAAYVEVFRNTPQLLQIVFWYVVMTHLPRPRQAFQPVEGVFLSNRGLQMPWPAEHAAWGWATLALVVALAGVWLLDRRAARRQRLTGKRPPVLLPAIALVIGVPVLAWAVAGAPTAIEWPTLRGFNFTGGAVLSPEFTALFLGLSLYIAAFIAEIVRSGLESVGRGQLEAARSIGLRPGQIYRLVLLPQALRVMVPPAAAQYVSLVKNSSLAVAIGYPDLVNISNTTMNQTGHTVEAIVTMSAVYLVISWTIALLMNWYNKAVMLKER